MFDLGWTEMMLIGVVALIVVGPKELPTLFRAVGQAVGKARGMAREFSRAMEAAADEAGVKEINRQINAAARPVQFAADRLKEGVTRPITSTPLRAAVPPAGTPLTPGAPAAAPGGTVLPAAAPVPLGPLDPGAPLPASPGALAGVAPGSATEALALQRAEERAARAAPPTPPADEAS